MKWEPAFVLLDPLRPAQIRRVGGRMEADGMPWPEKACADAACRSSHVHEEVRGFERFFFICPGKSTCTV